MTQHWLIPNNKPALTLNSPCLNNVIQPFQKCSGQFYSEIAVKLSLSFIGTFSIHSNLNIWQVVYSLEEVSVCDCVIDTLIKQITFNIEKLSAFPKGMSIHLFWTCPFCEEILADDSVGKHDNSIDVGARIWMMYVFLFESLEFLSVREIECKSFFKGNSISNILYPPLRWIRNMLWNVRYIQISLFSSIIHLFFVFTIHKILAAWLICTVWFQ